MEYDNVDSDEQSLQLNVGKTNRGFIYGELTDLYGQKCSIQESSLAGPSAIWLGIDTPEVKVLRVGIGLQDVELPEDVIITGRMHLSQSMVQELLPQLKYFAEHGELKQQHPLEDLANAAE